jgi:hypothetical protein
VRTLLGIGVAVIMLAVGVNRMNASADEDKKAQNRQLVFPPTRNCNRNPKTFSSKEKAHVG